MEKKKKKMGWGGKSRKRKFHRCDNIAFNLDKTIAAQTIVELGPLVFDSHILH